MKTKENFNTYKSKFNKWVKNGCPEIESTRDKIKFKPEPDEVFRPCYTTDKNDTYYKIRKYLPKYWFISNFGNIVSAWGKEVHVKIPTVSGKNGEEREQYDCNIKVKGKEIELNLDPAMLVCLTFDGECLSEAKRIIDKYGIYAIKKEGKETVELHHKNNHQRGYEKGAIEENRKLRKLNCRLDAIAIYPSANHSVLTGMRVTGNDKNFKAFRKLPTNNKLTAYLSNGAGAGEIIEGGSFALAPEGLIFIAAENRRIVVFPYKHMQCVVATDEDNEIEIYYAYADGTEVDENNIHKSVLEEVRENIVTRKDGISLLVTAINKGISCFDDKNGEPVYFRYRIING